MRQKILVMFGGLPHYYNPILEELNNFYEVVALIPDKKSLVFGEGIHESHEVKFKVIKGREYRTFYNKIFYRDFATILEKEKPNIVLANVSFVLGFVLFPSVKSTLNRLNILLCVKAIPFREPYYNEAVRHYYSVDLNKRPHTLLNKIVSYFKSLAFTSALKMAYRSAAGFVVYIPEGKTIYGSYGVSLQKIFVIYNSPDTDAIFATKSRINLKKLPPPNPYRVIHVGRLVSWKRVDLLIRAIAALKGDFPEIELVVVGDGPEKEYLMSLAVDLKLTEQIHFSGAIYNDIELGSKFMSSSLYVLAGMGGLSINEAMAYGLPVICSICDGTEKILVRDNYNGYIFEDGDLLSLIDAMKKVLENPEKREIMAANSLRIIQEEINMHRVIKEYRHAFETILNR